MRSYSENAGLGGEPNTAYGRAPGPEGKRKGKPPIHFLHRQIFELPDDDFVILSIAQAIGNVGLRMLLPMYSSEFSPNKAVD
jgi:hypothetical protein